MRLILIILLSQFVLSLAFNETKPNINSDRIILKNSIAYHFVRHVRNIDAEIFITRRISITPLVEGIKKLGEAKNRMQTFCDDMESYFVRGLRAPAGTNLNKRSYDTFLFLKEAGDVTFEEAKARCNDRGMQLPEIYENETRQQLVNILTFYNITGAFAGIAFDATTSLQRFINTGLPWWQGIYNRSISEDRIIEPLHKMSGSPHIRFFYGKENELRVMYEVPSPGFHGKSNDPDYREKYRSISLTTAPLVCQDKSMTILPKSNFKNGPNPKGFSYIFRSLQSNKRKKRELPLSISSYVAHRRQEDAMKDSASIQSQISSYVARRRQEDAMKEFNSVQSADLPMTRLNQSNSDFVRLYADSLKLSKEEVKLLRAKRLVTEDPKAKLSQEICHSLASHIGEIEGRSQDRLVKLLKLVDISIKVGEPEETEKIRHKRTVDNDTFSVTTNDTLADYELINSRDKRSPMLFLLKSGIRSVWSLFSFFEKVRTNRRLNRLEEEVERLQSQHEKSSGIMDKLSLIVANHSIIIGQLEVTTADLSKQVGILTTKVSDLDNRVNSLTSLVQVQQIMTLLASLVERTHDAMNHGFGVLENIIHRALMSETSAHLLPVEEIRKVQTELSIFSNSLLDPEYKRMKSVIVTDPQNPELLMAMINAAALSRKSQELVQLLPVPWFKNNEAIQPILSHEHVVLDQASGTFTVLNDKEAENCIKDGHCSASNPEQRTTITACGLPQFFDWHLNRCDFEPVLSGGMFMKRLGADGIVFSFKEKVIAQLFCQGITGPAQSIQGSGILQIPSGCTLTATDKRGEMAKIKSLPLSQIIQAQALDLIITGPGHMMKTKGIDEPGNVSNPFTRIITEHLSDLGKQLDDTHDEIRHYSNIMIILGSVLGITIVIIAILGALLYRYSSRFRKKVRNVRTELSGMGEKVVAFERQAAERARRADSPPPDIPPRNIKTLLYRLEAIEKRAQMPNDYLTVSELGPLNGKDSTSIYSNPPAVKTGTLPKPRERFLYPMAPLKQELYDSMKLEGRATPERKASVSERLQRQFQPYDEQKK